MHPVLELIRKRKEENSQPGRRNDKHKLGLAIEGGGMRGLVTSGMGTAIEKLKLLNTFDIVYGTSAGAFNGAYLIAGQANYGGTIYYQNINNYTFIDLRRFFSPGKSVMSLEYLVYEVATKQKVLDCQAIINSPIPLVMIVSSVEELKAVHFRNFSSADEIYKGLVATARMPVIAGPPVNIKGLHYYDGGVFESIPFHSAIADGCTHVLVFLSRPMGRQIPKPNIFEKVTTRVALRKYPGIEQALDKRREGYPKIIESLISKTQNGDGPPYIYAVQPSLNFHEVNRLERDRQKLLNGAIAGFSAVFKLFSEKDFRVCELLEVFSPDGRRLDG